MTDDPKSIPIERYIAIDAHKHYVMVGGLNAMLRQQLIVLNRQVKRPQLTQGDRLRLVLLARLTEFWQQALPSSRTRCCAGIATCSAAFGGANRSPRRTSCASHLKPSS